MTTWTPEELEKVGAAEELALAPLQRDGTPRKPVTISTAASQPIRYRSSTIYT